MAQVWLRWTMPCQITMSYEVAGMCVPFDAKTFQKDDAVSGLLAEFVFAVAGEVSDPAHGGYRGRRLQDGLIAGHAFLQPVSGGSVRKDEHSPALECNPLWQRSVRRRASDQASSCR